MKRDLSLTITVVVTLVLSARSADAAPLLAEQIKRSPEFYVLFFTGLAILFFGLIGLKTPEVREFLETLQYVTIESAPPLLFVIRAPWKFQTVSTAMIDEDKRIFAVFLDAQRSTKL